MTTQLPKQNCMHDHVRRISEEPVWQCEQCGERLTVISELRCMYCNGRMARFENDPKHIWNCKHKGEWRTCRNCGKSTEFDEEKLVKVIDTEWCDNGFCCLECMQEAHDK